MPPGEKAEHFGAFLSGGVFLWLLPHRVPSLEILARRSLVHCPTCLKEQPGIIVDCENSNHPRDIEFAICLTCYEEEATRFVLAGVVEATAGHLVAG